MRVVHVDIYQAGDTLAVDGAIALLEVACRMSTFVILEPVAQMNAEAYAKAMVKGFFQFGLPHTLVCDADPKFKADFARCATLLNINFYPLTGGNHDGMIVERFNRFLNSSLRIFTETKHSARVFVECALLSAYAWNSAPVVGTDISRSLVTLGSEFRFPIAYVQPQP